VAKKTQRKAPAKGKKKRWEKPRIKSGQLFESNSLACGKDNPGTDQCIQFAETS
jgi:hypothetical protein